MKRVLHISYVNDSKGGGIYFYLKELVKIEKDSGIDCYWISTINKNSALKKKELFL